MFSRARASIWLGIAVALMAVPAFAAEEHAGSGGMPQLNPATFAPQIFWLVVTFVALYLVMAKVALPRVGNAIETRANKISGDLDQAAKLKAQAEQVSAAYQKALADARAGAMDIGRQTAAKLAATSAERQAKLAADLTARIKSAEAEIARAKASAMANLVDVAGEAAASAATKLIGGAITSGEAANAARSVLAERG